jgi:hypothetical protein
MLFWDLEVSEEEEEEIIENIAQQIHELKMEEAAILFLETHKPLAYIGGEFATIFLSPYLPMLGRQMGMRGEKIIRIFRKQENVEKLVQRLEELAREDEAGDENEEEK